MTVQNIWPLAFCVLIPIIILLYILKQRAKDQTFSSILLWQEIYKNLEARTPFEKLKHNILMYLQILLLLLLLFALMAPVIKNGGRSTENVILVVDTSASMQYEYEKNVSRLEQSKHLALQQADDMSDGSFVTLVTCASQANVVYQGTDKATLKKRIRQIEETMDAGTLDNAAGLVQSLSKTMENVQVIGYTDSAFDLDEWKKGNEKATWIVESVYSKGDNCSMDYVNYTLQENEIEALCKVSNDGDKDVTQDVSLYAGDRLLTVLEVTIPAGEEKTVYFDKQTLDSDQSCELRAELSESDSLTADNTQSVICNASGEKKVLLLSEGNVFLEKALSLNDSVTVYKSEDVSVLKQDSEPYDLYVFDGITLPDDFSLEEIPQNAGVLFFHMNEHDALDDYMKAEEPISDAVLSFQKSDVTEYVEDVAFGVTTANIYELPEWAVPVLQTTEGKTVGYYGRTDGRMAGVIGFDIHDTDLALKTEFPIFMSQLAGELLGDNGQKVEITNFPVAEESNATAVEDAVVKGSQQEKKMGGRMIRNWILVIVILLLIVEWIVYVSQVNSSKQKQYLVVRSLLVLMILLAMAGISIPKHMKKTETIFLIDVSDSMKGNITQIEDYLKKTIAKMPNRNVAGVVTFGKDMAVDRFLSENTSFSTFTTEPVTTATNIENAVTAACSMFDEGAGKQIVLITDGSENEGNMSIAASLVRGKEIELSAISVEDSIDHNPEVYIDGLNAPKVIHAGDHYNVTASVQSNVETDAVLSLYSGRVAKGQQDIHVTKGQNQFVFDDVGEEGMIAQYKAVIEPAKDTISVNNTYVTYAQIVARPRLLLVEGTSGEASEFEKLLRAANVDYDTVTPAGAPNSLSDLNQYKAVITLNVYYDDLAPGFARLLPSYIKDYAGGYICIGGENSYALGNYKGTELEEVLPVNMDLQGEKELPKMAMAMVIDQSGSMISPSIENSQVTGLDLAKQAAISGVSQLRSTDEVGVLAFDDSYHWMVPMQNADDMDQIEEGIASIGYGGGTSIYPALEEAYKEISKSDAKINHIILLTDGQDEYRQYHSLLKQIKDADITVSTVAVGEESDQTMLSNIADICGGRFYYTDVNNSIPRIFAQEVYLSTNTYLINQEFYPDIVSDSDILSGAMDEGCPALLGYIASTPKNAANVILESDQGDPILTTWQYGLGRTVAWNSDGDNVWTANYANWDNYPTLWSNIIQYVIADTELGDDAFEIHKDGNTVTLSYTTKEYDKDTAVFAVVSDENGSAKDISFEAVKPGTYEAALDVGDVGIYSINLRKNQGNDIVKTYNTAYANQYSLEYQFSGDTAALDTFVSQAAGKMISMDDSVWNRQNNTVRASVPLTVPLLIFSIFFFLFDIIARRWAIDMLGFVKKGLKRINNKKRFQRKRPFKEKEKKNKHIKERKTKKSAKKKLQAEQNGSLDMNQLLEKKRERN